MGLYKIEIEKWDRKGDFSMWNKKMRAVLVQQKRAKARDPIDFPEVMKSSDKQEIMKNAYSLLILNLAENRKTRLRRYGQILDPFTWLNLCLTRFI